MKITNWVVHLAPVGVAFLIAGEILHMRSVYAELVKLAWYLITVTLGITIQGFVILPIIYGLVTKTLPFKFIGKMGPALATAFGTASSAATLPVTINSLEEGNKIDPRISRFVLPIGATINMDGTALYEAVAAIFIAQMTGMNPTLGQIIIISITATAASIGAAGIPHAGLVTLVMVLETVGLPSEAVSIIMSVDWLVDRVRTAVNVLGDAFGAAIVAHLSKDELRKLNETGNTDFEMNDVEKSKLLEIDNFDTIESFDTIEEKLAFAARPQAPDSVLTGTGSPTMSYSAQAGRVKSRCVEM
jgi:Na+/H+-dicarboxylate symporter